MATGDGDALNFEWEAEVVDSISEAISEVAEIYQLSGRIKAALPDELGDHVKAFIRALDYDRRRRSSRGQAVDDMYGPMFTTTDGYAYPELLSAVTPDTIKAWADAVHLFEGHDVVVGRLCDLLWSLKAKQPRPDRYARAAQAAFRRLWGSSQLASVHRSDALIRALELASELGEEALVADTVVEVVAAIRETLADEEWAPGVAVPMLEALAGLPESARPAEVGELIRDARGRYADDPFINESLMLLEMQRAGADLSERKRIALETVDMWRDQAEARGGLVGQSHLERALELARNEGLVDAANELRLLLQRRRSTDELGMQKVSSDITIPADAIDGFVRGFVETSGPAETLARLAVHCPIVDLDSDIQAVREQMQQFPLQHLFSTVVTNSDGIPIAHITSDEQKFAHALNRHHSMAVTLWGSFLGLILQRLQEDGRLSVAELQEHVLGEFIDESTAEGIGKAYAHLLAGDFEAALHFLLVRIERVVREIARSLGMSVFREPSLDGKSMGAYKGLGELLSLLERRVPENQRRYFAVMLTERTGLNLRNRSAHGLMQAVSLEEAVLALHVLIVVSRWSTIPPEGEAPAE